MNRFLLPSLLILTFFLNTGCSSSRQLKSEYTYTTTDSLPDYASLNYWAAHPFKKDPSDSVPKPLLGNYSPDSSVDVFFIYPTTYLDPSRALGWNAPINNGEINQRTDYSSILFQASIFNEVGRVFSPRYRQANLTAYYPKDAADSSNAIAAFELAYQDIKTAFQYYLEHYNNNRPIIIASHSQGSTHGKRLLKELFDNSNLKNRLVAAYLVGMPIETNYFSNLKACLNPWQTGCICSWRTYKDGYQPEFVAIEKFTAIVTNPLTWDSSKPSAARDLNKGGVLLNFNNVVKRVTNAAVNGNILWSEKPHFFGNIFYTTQNYHVADMNLYYLSIRENAALRAKAFAKK